jgi:hypothetical protein
MKRLRMLAVASAGGHWVQLRRLAPLLGEHDTCYVTTLAGVALPADERPPIIIPDASRNAPVRLILVWLRLLLVIIRFRPDVIVTTGAAPGLMALQIGKLLRAHTIWIDSIANSEELSMSGQIAGRFADLWVTQWPHLAETQPSLQYLGAVL